MIVAAFHRKMTGFFLPAAVVFFLYLSVTVSLAVAADPELNTEKIRIIADRLTSNSQENYAEFEGNVEASQGDFQITSDALRIYYKPDKTEGPTSGDQNAIQKVVATGNVKIKAEDKRATTDRVEYTPETGMLIMTGPNSTLISERNSISGSRITLQRESRQVRVDGSERERVTAVFYTTKGKTEGLLALPEQPSGDPQKTGQVPQDVEIIETKPDAADAGDKKDTPDMTNAEADTPPDREKEPVAAPAAEQNPDVEIVETKPAAVEPAPEPETEITTTVPPAAEMEKDTPAMSYVDADSGEKKTVGQKAEPTESLQESIADIAAEDGKTAAPAEKKPEEEKDVTDIAAVEPAEAPETVSADAPQAVAAEEPVVEPAATVPDEKEIRAQYATVGVDALLKRVAIPAFENQTFYKGPEIKTIFYDGLVDQIAANTQNTLISTPASPQFPNFLNALPRHPSGQVDNFALASLGRQLGLNYIITGVITEIAVDRGVSGFLWLKETNFIVQVSTSIDVYDVETGTKVLTDSYTYTINLDDTTYDISQVEKEMPAEFIDEAFTNLVPQIGEAVTEVLNEAEWKGFVTAVTTKDVAISAGNEVGLQVGNVFSVYDVKVIEGASGHNFIVPGLKTGEVILTEVSASQSRATLISGDGIREGSSIKKIEK